MAYSVLNGTVGTQQLTPYNLPDSTARQVPGMALFAMDNFWGGGEFLYVKANGAIRQYGLCVITQVITNNAIVFNATEVPNTANLGRMVVVAMVSAASGQFFWACKTGVVPVNCNAAVAADTAYGIAAAGQGGAITAGKQVLNSRIAIASTQTIAKTGCTANSGSTRLLIPNDAGWFAGIYLSGTGIAATTTVTDIDPSGTIATLSLATTAAVNGTVTGTYNNATVFYNIAHVNRPFAQGQIV